MKKSVVATLSALPHREPAHALVADVDLVVVRYGDSEVSVFYGRCLHRGALLSDGFVRGDNLICGVHDWDYRVDSGVSEYNNDEALPKFRSWVDGDEVCVDSEEIAAWAQEHPQPYDREAYLGQYADVHGTGDEPATSLIHSLAKGGIEGVGHHGPVAAMGVPPVDLPRWDDLQLLTAQLHRFPLLDEEPVGTDITIGPRAERPLRLDIPLFVSDMSFGALSEEAKIALARGAEMAGTGICSGEGGMLPEEKAENSRYLYELASARFGFDLDALAPKMQAFHFKGGQGAKTGTGGHLPGHKVQGKIAKVRGLEPGTAAISPSRFPEWTSLQDFRDMAARVREATGGVPIGFKLSAQHIEKDLDAALEIGVDYVILDGRGGGTGAAPLLFRDHISVPTMPALARARRHLDATGNGDVTLIATGGLRTPADFAKALALGADAVAVSNSAIQAIGCLAMRACHTNNCPVGIATQREDLRQRLEIAKSAKRLENFFTGATELMKVLARACGHSHLSGFSSDDLTTWKRDIADLTGVAFGAREPDRVVHGLDFVLLGGFVLAYALVSRRLERTPLTAPILAVLFGIAVGPMGLHWLSLDVRDGTMRLLAEFTLALVLFHDAARIDLRLLRKNLGTPERLLGPGLVLTIVLGTGVGYLLLPELSIWEVVLLAAMLAPTDAALGQAVVTNEAVPLRVRQALNVESGLNDGLVVPVVAVTIACAAGAGDGSAWTWTRHALEASGYGIGVGVLIGMAAAKLLDRAHRADWIRDGSRHIGLAAVPVVAFFAAESLHGSGFLAAFLAGIALGSTTKDVDREGFEFTEDAGEALGHVTWVGFGAAAAPLALECASPGTIAYALLSLTVVRMLPVALSLRGAGFHRDTVAFIGWFGPRGLATVVFAAAAFGEAGIPNREMLFGVAVWTVLLSVLLHGTTAGVFARAYGARCRDRASTEPPAEGLEVPTLPHARRRVPATR